MDIATWLRSLGLEQYEPAFRDNDIDAELVSRLTTEDLKDLGVVSVGHRRKLLDAIAALNNAAGRSESFPGDPGAASAPTYRSSQPRQPDAERRQITILFCDLVRSTELVGILARCWEQACAGEGQAILLSGEVGIGKSRLVRGLLDCLQSEAYARVQHQCAPLFSNSPLHPFMEQIERDAGFQSKDTPEERLICRVWGHHFS